MKKPRKGLSCRASYQYGRGVVFEMDGGEVTCAPSLRMALNSLAIIIEWEKYSPIDTLLALGDAGTCMTLDYDIASRKWKACLVVYVGLSKHFDGAGDDVEAFSITQHHRNSLEALNLLRCEAEKVLSERGPYLNLWLTKDGIEESNEPA